MIPPSAVGRGDKRDHATGGIDRVGRARSLSVEAVIVRAGPDLEGPPLQVEPLELAFCFASSRGRRETSVFPDALNEGSAEGNDRLGIVGFCGANRCRSGAPDLSADGCVAGEHARRAACQDARVEWRGWARADTSITPQPSACGDSVLAFRTNDDGVGAQAGRGIAADVEGIGGPFGEQGSGRSRRSCNNQWREPEQPAAPRSRSRQWSAVPCFWDEILERRQRQRRGVRDGIGGGQKVECVIGAHGFLDSGPASSWGPPGAGVDCP